MANYNLFDAASLAMIPTGYKEDKVYSIKPTDGSGDLAFTRSNDTATRVGPDGLIEKVRTNLVPYSEQFDNAAWVKAATGTGLAPVVTANNALAPDGTMTADTIVFDAGAGTTASDSSRISQVITANGLFNGSFFARVASGTGQLMFRHVAGSSYTTINLTTTYQRFSVAETGATGFFEITIRRGLNEPMNASVTAQLWGAQLESGDIATPYIPTTTAAVSVGPVADLPRLDYSGGASCPSLLLEPQRTNLVLRSEEFNLSPWGNRNSPIITANNAIAPDGTMSADSFNVSDSALSGRNQVVVLGAGTYTFSCYLKRNVSSVVGGAMRLRVIADGSTNQQFVNLTNDWVRYYFTFTAAVGVTLAEILNSSINHFDAWGAQLEVGSYPTSYIPTLAAAVTRSADVCNKTSIASLIGQTEGTLYAEVSFDDIGAGGASAYVYFTDGSFANAVLVGREPASPNSKFLFFIQASGISVLNNTANNITSGVVKMALAYKSGDWAAFLNGNLVASGSTTFTFNSSMSRFGIGTNDGAITGTQGSTRAAQTLLFKTRLSNTELAALTA